MSAEFPPDPVPEIDEIDLGDLHRLDLAEWIVELLDRHRPCGPDCPCVLIEDTAEVIEVRRKRGPKPE